MSDLVFGVKFTGDGKALVSETKAVSKSVDKLKESIKDNGNEAAKLRNEYQRTTKTTQSLAEQQKNWMRINASADRAIQSQSKSFRTTEKDAARLLDKYDPLGKKLRELEKDFKALDRAAAAGKISGRDDNRVDSVYQKLQGEIELARAGIDATGTSANQTGKRMRDLGLNTQYARRQMAQIGKEAMIGDFGRLPSSIGALVTESNLLSAIMSPMGLAVAGVTTALVAGGYAWSQWGRAAKEAIEKAQTDLDRLKEKADASARPLTPEEQLQRAGYAIQSAQSDADYQTSIAANDSKSNEVRRIAALAAGEARRNLANNLKLRAELEKEIADKQKSAADKRKTEAGKIADAYQKSIKSADDYILKLKQEAEEIGLTADQVLMLKAAREAEIAPTKKKRDEIIANAFALVQQQSAYKDATEAEKLATQAALDAKKVIDNRVTSLTTEVEQLRLRNAAIGLSTQDTDALILARIDEEIAAKAGNAALAEEVTLLKEKRKLVAEGQSRQADFEEGKRAADEFKRTWESVDRVAQDAFVSMLQGGRDVFTRLRDTLKSTLYDLLYQMTLRKWVFQITATVTGAGASGLAAADPTGSLSGSGGAGGWLQAGQSLWSGFNAGFSQFGVQVATVVNEAGIAIGRQSLQAASSSIGLAGSYIGAGAAGITLGSLIAGDKQVFGLNGTTTSAIGSALGAVVGGPLGAFIGGTIGGAVNALFGSGPMQYGPTTLQGDFTQAGFAGRFAQTYHADGGLLSSDTNGVNYTALNAEQQASFNNLTAGAASVFDDLTRAAGGRIRSLDGWTFAINQQINTEEQQAQLITDLGNSMGRFLLPELAALQKEGESFADTAVRLRDEFRLTDTIAMMMGKNISEAFGAIGFASAEMRDNLVARLGGVQGADRTMQSYYQNFFGEAERRDNGIRQVNAALTQLGVEVLPTTRREFRALVDQQDLSTAAGQAMFASLMAIESQFAAVTTGADALASGLQSLSDSLHSALNNIGGTGGLTRNQGQAQLETALAIANAGGPLPTSASLSSALAAVQQNSANEFASFTAYQQDIARTKATISALANIADARLGSAAVSTSIPAFAAGGAFSGGMRLVGERGPELEITGPSRIVSNSDTQKLFDLAPIIKAIERLDDNQSQLLFAIAADGRKLSRIIEQQDKEGLPPVRVR